MHVCLYGVFTLHGTVWTPNHARDVYVGVNHVNEIYIHVYHVTGIHIAIPTNFSLIHLYEEREINIRVN